MPRRGKERESLQKRGKEGRKGATHVRIRRQRNQPRGREADAVVATGGLGAAGVDDEGGDVLGGGGGCDEDGLAAGAGYGGQREGVFRGFADGCRCGRRGY